MSEHEHEWRDAGVGYAECSCGASGPADPEPIRNETASGYARRWELVVNARAMADAYDLGGHDALLALRTTVDAMEPDAYWIERDEAYVSVVALFAAIDGMAKTRGPYAGYPPPTRDLRDFIGAAPGLTGGLIDDDFVRQIRGKA